MKKLGFTLAEVLITLVIIGVIAAMTVPSVLNNTNAQEYRSAFKKAIAATNQALTLHYALEGMAAQDYSDSADITDNLFKVRMSIIEDDAVTSFTNTDACGGTNIWTTADGMMYCITDFSSADADSQDSICNSYNTVQCAADDNSPNLYIDVNGAKNPNQVTESSTRPRDIYGAMIYSQKVIPWGEAAQQVMYDKKLDTAVGS